VEGFPVRPFIYALRRNPEAVYLVLAVYALGTLNGFLLFWVIR
jgi:hypothetical protein